MCKCQSKRALLGKPCSFFSCIQLPIACSPLLRRLLLQSCSCHNCEPLSFLSNKGSPKGSQQHYPLHLTPAAVPTRAPVSTQVDSLAHVPLAAPQPRRKLQEHNPWATFQASPLPTAMTEQAQCLVLRVSLLQLQQELDRTNPSCICGCLLLVGIKM